MRKVNYLRGLLIITAAGLLAACGEDSPKIEVPSFAEAELQQGRATWMQVCRNCHLLGVAGAPALADYAAWQSRLARDRQSLYENAIDGIRGDNGWRMPPRGGNDALSDGDVKRAVDFMLAAVEQLNR
jgi:cytochrome c5